MLIPTHNNTGGMAAAVTRDKNGNGMVSAMYRLNSVSRINGDRRKTDVELLADVVFTAELRYNISLSEARIKIGGDILNTPRCHSLYCLREGNIASV